MSKCTYIDSCIVLFYGVSILIFYFFIISTKLTRFNKDYNKSITFSKQKMILFR